MRPEFLLLSILPTIFFKLFLWNILEELSPRSTVDCATIPKVENSAESSIYGNEKNNKNNKQQTTNKTDARIQILIALNSPAN